MIDWLGATIRCFEVALPMNSRSRSRWWVVGGGNASDTSDYLRIDSGGDMRRLGLIVALSLFGVTEGQAQVVALGPSSTRGYLLPLTDAWAAKLEALLRQHGANLSVANEGINGDTSDGMLSRLDLLSRTERASSFSRVVAMTTKTRIMLWPIATATSRRSSAGSARAELPSFSSASVSTGRENPTLREGRERHGAGGLTKASLRATLRIRQPVATRLRKVMTRSPRACFPAC